MKTPEFWRRKNLLSTLLLPIAYLYRLAGLIRTASITPKQLRIPSICIGNVTAGGSGKTPVALYIGALCKQHNINAYFVSRGYKGTLSGPVKVDLATHTAKQVGDEPLLLATTLPTIIGKDRIKAANHAINDGAELLIFDDGFQNPHIHKNISLLVVDTMVGFGNERLIPAGPLREGYKSGLKRAQAVIILNPNSSAPFVPPAKPSFRANVTLSTPQAMPRDVVAFCGLAYPEKFFVHLADLGLSVRERVSFSDHHHYNARDLERLEHLAKQHHATLVTTAKDAVRIPESYKKNISILDMSLEFDKASSLEEWLMRTIRTHA